jgi:transposase InsO family protein
VNWFFARAGVPDYPEWIVTDHGPEFTGRALDEWAYQHRVQLHFIEPDLGRSDPQRPAREFSKDPSRKKPGH